MTDFARVRRTQRPELLVGGLAACQCGRWGPRSWLFAPEDSSMLLPSFRTRREAGLLLAVPLAALAVLACARDKPRSKEPVTNSLKMQLVLIPAGKFTMGSPESEKDRSPSEEQHEAEIKEPFFLGIHEVRVQDFRAFVEDDGYKTQGERTKFRLNYRGGVDLDN